ncbi:MAG: hypothetical protein MJY93_06325 [Fibrobacter sp.]|nr:hypothetical protein [Fibrobacter sp.]
MQEGRFRDWLVNVKGLTAGPVSDALSRCRRLERDLNIDFDRKFSENCFQDVLDMLTYSAADAAAGVGSPGNIQINGNVQRGMASLKNAAKLYYDFCRNRR